MDEGLIKKPLAKNDIKINGKDDIVGSSSVTPFLVFSTFVAGFASFTFGCATGYSSAAEAGIVADLGLSTAQYSLFGSIMTLGSMFGAIACGKLADLLGRKSAMLVMDIFFILGWLAIIFAETAFLLHLGRFSLGIGAGIFAYLSPVYVAEIAPKNLRGGFASALQMMTGIGVSLTYFIGNVIAWRTLAVIGALPCLLLLLGLFFIPESPRWLAKYGNEKQLKDTLQRLRGVNVDVTEETTEIRDSTETLHHLSRSRFVEIFERKYGLSLIVVIGTMVIVPLAGSMAIMFYASSIFKVAGSSISFDSSLCFGLTFTG
ncbi:sugar transporter ERD6-like 5 [Heracleum sosnowskyi]|uniref:Sugar transporter ERD6-like 5 n=1 Tax=Heracleum sosnowskyi TaxID=360622 RepID=A0AAD8M347_9APIA|nr:sugar transporter ERD6-like 5 [Heracleum sosnowskyi]